MRQVVAMRLRFAAWGLMLTGKRQLSDKGESLREHACKQVLKTCWGFWVKWLASAGADTQLVGHFQDFPYDCRVLLSTRDFPYGAIGACALISLHRARASHVWNAVTAAGDRRMRSFLNEWHGKALMKRRWVLLLHIGRHRLQATRLRRVMASWQSGAEWESIRIHAVASCCLRQASRVRQRKAFQAWQMAAQWDWNIVASSSRLVRRRLHRALLEWRDNIEVSITLARRRVLAEQMRRKRGRTWLRAWERYIDVKWHVDDMVQRCTRALSQRSVSAWSWISCYRRWSQGAVDFCLQRQHMLVLRRIFEAWEQEIGDRTVVRHIRGKIRRVRCRFATSWWMQYVQEKSLSRRVRSNVNLRRLLQAYEPLETHTGVFRLRTSSFYFVCARRVNATIDAHFSSWLSFALVTKRVRSRLANFRELITRRRARVLAERGLLALYEGASITQGIACITKHHSNSVDITDSVACAHDKASWSPLKSSRGRPVVRSRLCGSAVSRFGFLEILMERRHRGRMHDSLLEWRAVARFRRVAVRHACLREARVGLDSLCVCKCDSNIILVLRVRL